jgi:hypothetical protein
MQIHRHDPPAISQRGGRTCLSPAMRRRAEERLQLLARVISAHRSTDSTNANQRQILNSDLFRYEYSGFIL